MNPKSAIEKGKRLENHVVDRLRETGLDPKACRSAGSGSGNRDKADIVTSLMVDGENLGIECKNHSRPKMVVWWKQTLKLQGVKMIPVLVWKLGNEKFLDTKATIHLETLLTLLRGAKFNDEGMPEVQYDYEKQREIKKAVEDVIYTLGNLEIEDRELKKWETKNAKTKLRRLLKVLEVK